MVNRVTYSAAFTKAVRHFRVQVRYIENWWNFAWEHMPPAVWKTQKWKYIFLIFYNNICYFSWQIPVLCSPKAYTAHLYFLLSIVFPSESPSRSSVGLRGSGWGKAVFKVSIAFSIIFNWNQVGEEKTGDNYISQRTVHKSSFPLHQGSEEFHCHVYTVAYVHMTIKPLNLNLRYADRNTQQVHHWNNALPQ